MYKKIYINERPLILCDPQYALALSGQHPSHLAARYLGKTKNLLNYIDLLEKTQRYDAVYLYNEDVEELFRDFKKLYKIIKAAGGLVFNELGEALMISRMGYWDLPKGKIEEDESKREAAVREVMEETGLERVELGERLAISWHTYRNRGDKRVLKKTYWYRMTAPKQPLSPQTEESIEEAVWVDLANFMHPDLKIYGNIRDLIQMALQP